MQNIKGIILAGGYGTRLYPITMAVSKQLLPVYDKPMIYYSLATLMNAMIKDILVITTPYDNDSYKKLLGDGSQFGINISYMIQEKPSGIAEAFILGEEYIGESNVALILGDNIFHGQGFRELLTKATKKSFGATVFAYHVNNPNEFGIIEFDENNRVISIEEKPNTPKSNYAITGLYFYDNKVIKYAKNLKPSKRRELEISDINKVYLKENCLNVEILGNGFAWLDSGTHNSLLEAGHLIQTLEKRQGIKIACLEEISFMNSWIKSDQLLEQGKKFEKTDYGKYILEIYKKVSSK